MSGQISTLSVRIRPAQPASVWVTHRFVGFHAWPDAPPRRLYLASLHRHVFHVKTKVHVMHDDREVEFHDLLDRSLAAAETLGEPMPPDARNLGPMSCEMIARNIAAAVSISYPGRTVVVEVSEDGESGAIVFDRSGDPSPSRVQPLEAAD